MEFFLHHEKWYFDANDALIHCCLKKSGEEGLVKEEKICSSYTHKQAAHEYVLIHAPTSHVQKDGNETMACGEF